MTFNDSHQHVVKTTAQWGERAVEYWVVPRGCLCVELTPEGKTKLKVGEGNKFFSQLPYICDHGDLSNYYTKEEIDTLFNNLNRMAIVSTDEYDSKDDLPLTDNKLGDVRFVKSDDEDPIIFIWNGTKWISTKSDTDLSDYVTKSEFNVVKDKVDEIYPKAHTHANKDILDGITQADRDKFDSLHNYDDTEIRELIEETGHTHPNKALLDTITQSSLWSSSDRDKFNDLHNYDDTQVKFRLVTVEEKAHTHANKTVLDGITQEKLDEINYLAATYTIVRNDIRELQRKSHVHDNLNVLEATTAAYTIEQENELRRLSNIDVFLGAGPTWNGVFGYVPAPLAGDENKFLRGDGTWAVVESGDAYIAGDHINFSRVDPDGLPAEYTRVEYIESAENANVYLDTGYNGNTGFTAVLDLQYYPSSHRQLMGLYPGTGNYFGSNADEHFEMGSGVHTASDTTQRNTVTWHHTLTSSAKLEWNGSYVTDQNGYGGYNENFKLFSPFSDYKSQLKIFSCIMYDNNDQVVRNFIPCKTALGVAGFYDTVTEQFYSGQPVSLIAGPVVPPSGPTAINADEMVGADGTNAGEAGVVPAPLASDNTKFLRGDGTWAEVGSENYAAGQGITFTHPGMTDLGFDFATYAATITSVRNGTRSVDLEHETLTLTATNTDCYTEPYSTSAVYSFPIVAGHVYRLTWESSDNTVHGRVLAFENHAETYVYETDTRVRDYLEFTAVTTGTVNFRFGVQITGTTLVYSNINFYEIDDFDPNTTIINADISKGLEFDSLDKLQVSLGDGLAFDSNDAIEIEPATDSTIGGVIVGTGLSVDNDGVISADDYQAGRGIIIDSTLSQMPFSYSGFINGVTQVERGTIVKNNDDSFTLTATGDDCFTQPFSLDQGSIASTLYLFSPVGGNRKYRLTWTSTDRSIHGRVFVFENGRGTPLHEVDQAINEYLEFTTAAATTSLSFRFGVANTGDTLTYSNIKLYLVTGGSSTIEAKLGNGLQFDANGAIEVTSSGGNNYRAGDGIEITTIYPPQQGFQVEDTDYYFDTNVQCTIGGRTFTKYTTDPALGVICHARINSGGGQSTVYSGPMFFGLSENAVKVHNDYSGGQTEGSMGTFEYKGYTWYISAHNYMNDGSTIVDGGIPRIDDLVFTFDGDGEIELGKMVIDLAGLITDPIDEFSAKLGNGLQFDANGAIEVGTQYVRVNTTDSYVLLHTKPADWDDHWDKYFELTYDEITTSPPDWDPTQHYKYENDNYVLGTAGDTFVSTTWYNKHYVGLDPSTAVTFDSDVYYTGGLQLIEDGETFDTAFEKVNEAIEHIERLEQGFQYLHDDRVGVRVTNPSSENLEFYNT